MCLLPSEPVSASQWSGATCTRVSHAAHEQSHKSRHARFHAGPNGNGKSTLLKDIVRSISGGIGYMEVRFRFAHPVSKLPFRGGLLVAAKTVHRPMSLVRSMQSENLHVFLAEHTVVGRAHRCWPSMLLMIRV